MSFLDNLASQSLVQYNERVYPTRLAWLVLLYESHQLSNPDFHGMTSFELEAYAHRHTGITRNAITANLRKCAQQGLVHIEYVSVPEQRGYCAFYTLTQQGQTFVKKLLQYY